MLADVLATGVSVLTVALTTVFGPLQAFLKTTSLDIRQWLICLAVALSIVVVSEIRKAVRRRTALRRGHDQPDDQAGLRPGPHVNSSL